MVAGPVASAVAPPLCPTWRRVYPAARAVVLRCCVAVLCCGVVGGGGGGCLGPPRSWQPLETLPLQQTLLTRVLLDALGGNAVTTAVAVVGDAAAAPDCHAVLEAVSGLRSAVSLPVVNGIAVRVRHSTCNLRGGGVGAYPG
jgi:hypothetical protein